MRLRRSEGGLGGGLRLKDGLVFVDEDLACPRCGTIVHCEGFLAATCEIRPDNDCEIVGRHHVDLTL